MITDADYQEHMAAVAAEGFVLDPPGYERLTQWTHVLMHCVNANANFERLQTGQRTSVISTTRSRAMPSLSPA